MILKHIVLLFALVVAIRGQQNSVYQRIYDEFANCATSIDGYTWDDAEPTFSFYRYNDGAYRVKEVRIYNSDNQELLSRLIWNNLGEYSTARISTRQRDLNYDFEFILPDETRICIHGMWGSNGYYRYNCPGNVRQVVCPTLPTHKLAKTCSTRSNCANPAIWENQWQCVNEECLRTDPTATRPCTDLYTWNFFNTAMSRPARVMMGFRLSDCEGAVFDNLTADVITVREGEVDLVYSETKQQLVPVEDTKCFVQLMVSLCPRSVVLIDDIIYSLNSFVVNVNLNDSYIALSVFDGALGYVDLLHFTNDFDLINQTIANLTNFELRDETCNVKQSIATKFAAVSAHLYGQPWDTVHFVIFTATGDLVNYNTDLDVSLPISRRRDISTYLIGQNLPSSQISLFKALGMRGIWTTTTTEMTTTAFVDVATSISASSRGAYLFGYCSASRVGDITANVNLNLNLGKFGRIQQVKYTANNFTAGCTAIQVREFCSPCRTTISSRDIICYNCFNQSFATLTVGMAYARVLLRNPAAGSSSLQLPFPKGNTTKYNVYIRMDGVANPLLYDYKYLLTSERSLQLPGAVPGGLIGVYVDWNGGSYNATLGIKLVPNVQAPVAAPVNPPTNPPVNSPVQPPVESPVGFQPIQEPTTNTPVDLTPVSSPVESDPPISSPIQEPIPYIEPIAEPMAGPQADEPLQAPVSEPVRAPVYPSNNVVQPVSAGETPTEEAVSVATQATVPIVVCFVALIFV